MLARRSGWQVSRLRRGRILTHLRRNGRLWEAPRRDPCSRRRHQQRPHATRKPRSYQALAPGDLVEVDTADIRPVPGVVYKHFTARDVVSRWDVLEVHYRATAQASASFLDALAGC